MSGKFITIYSFTSASWAGLQTFVNTVKANRVLIDVPPSLVDIQQSISGNLLKQKSS